MSYKHQRYEKENDETYNMRQSSACDYLKDVHIPKNCDLKHVPPLRSYV